MSIRSKSAAQQRAHQIAAFRSEPAIVENAQVLTLGQGQRGALADSHT